MYLLRKIVMYSFAFEINRRKNNYFLNINGSQITNSSIFQSLIPDHVSVGHAMNKSTVADEFECHQKCLRNNSCKSSDVHAGAATVKSVLSGHRIKRTPSIKRSVA